jgi:alpha-1,3-mannosylglycoprotein beta-1,4-N-acetylglucosaminyltransferase A/B
MGSPEETPSIKAENEFTQQLRDLEWRIKSAMAQSNQRSRDFVDIRNDISAVAQRMIAREARVSRKPFPRAPSSLDQPVHAVVDKVAGSDMERLGAELLPGMDHLHSSQSLQPAFELSKQRQGVSLAVGIPTVKRDVQSYLLNTITSLMQAMTKDEVQDVVVIVFIAEFDTAYVESVANDIKSRFPSEVNSGVLEIISPPRSFYPDLENIRLSFGDDKDRVRWRTKQNLDYAFMMLYARNKGQFYLQLEDDVLSTPGFMSRVTGFIHEREQMSQNWVFLEFSALGFIGKLFRSSDLHTLASFFLMFHKDKPIDWLLDHFLFVKVCNPEQDMRQCAKDKETVRIRHKPSLFQHVGQHSSLKGKIQKLKDRDFKNNLPPPPFTNPPAHLSTSLEVYQRHTLDQLYLSRDIFWAMTPKKGDTIEFIFEKPTMLSK